MTQTVATSNYRDNVGGQLLRSIRALVLQQPQLVEALDILVNERNSRVIFSILQETKSDVKRRNMKLLLYRYHATKMPVTEASELSHNIEGLIQLCLWL